MPIQVSRGREAVKHLGANSKQQSAISNQQTTDNPFPRFGLLFTVCCSLFAVHRLLFTVCCSLFAVHCLLLTVCCSLFAGSF